MLRLLMVIRLNLQKAAALDQDVRLRDQNISKSWFSRISGFCLAAENYFLSKSLFQNLVQRQKFIFQVKVYFWIPLNGRNLFLKYKFTLGFPLTVEIYFSSK